MSTINDNGQQGPTTGSNISLTGLWSAHNSQIIAAVALVVSTFSLLQSCEQNSLGKKIPFQTALYETRVTALQSYATAHFMLGHSFRVTFADMPHDVYSPQALSLTSDLGMQENAVVARRFMLEYENYRIKVYSSKLLWPKEIQLKIEEAGDRATEASQCFIMLGQKTLKDGTYTEDHLSSVYTSARMNASNPCDDIQNLVVVNKFLKAGADAIIAMEDNLRQTQSDLVPK